MKKLVIHAIAFVLLFGTFANVCVKAQEDVNKTDKASNNVGGNKYWQPILEEYNKGNYFNAIVNLKNKIKMNEKLGKKEDVYAIYYLALCYHNLGYIQVAKEEYKRVLSVEKDSDLAFYSKKALACIDDPKSAECTGKKKEKKPELSELEKAQQEEIKQLRQQVSKLQDSLAPKVNPNDDDISRFIKSKQKIHPAAMDRITIERMERKLQADEYSKKQQEENMGTTN